MPRGSRTPTDGFTSIGTSLREGLLARNSQPQVPGRAFLVYALDMDDGAIRTVLLVDDEPDIRRIAQLTLSKLAGWRVLLASSGDEAVEVAGRESPDVVLLDVMMPEMDGPTTLQRLRDLPDFESTPVIFMTARVQRAEIARYVSLGAAGVIAKPFDPFGLPDEIRKLVSTPS